MDVDEKISYFEVAGIYEWAKFDTIPYKNINQA